MSSTAQSMFIETRQLKKAYATPAGEFLALKGIDIQIAAGEFIAVIGKSGSGKSTLINMLTGIDHPSSGTVTIGGTNLHTLNETAMARWRGRNLGIVFQFFQLLPTLTLIENIMLPMDLNNSLPPKERRGYAHRLLELVDMAAQADKLPSAVSGGQQQRVAIARALANDPPMIVADEPTGNLDSATADKIFQLFEGLVASGKTIIMVTHDDTLARRASRSIMIADGEVVDPHLRDALHMLTQDQIIELKRAVKPQHFAPGQTLIQQGEVGDRFYILLEGNVKAYHQGVDGSEVIVNHLVPGQFFGEMALVGNGVRQNTIRASELTPVLVAVLDRAEFNHLMQQSPAMQQQIGATIEHRIQLTNARLQAAQRFKEQFQQVQTQRQEAQS